MSSESIKQRRDGAVLEVTLDRPKANAIDAATSRAMGEVFAGFRDDPALRVAIVTGGGERFFSAGWDLKAAAEGESVESDYGVGGFGGLQELPDLNKPVIAAVNGIAVGGGFELALSADMIIAAEEARFALPEINAGTLADAATIKLPRRMPYHIAMDLLLTGRWMEAEEAARWGVVNEVVPGDRLMTRAREIAALLADGPAPGLRVDQGGAAPDRDSLRPRVVRAAAQRQGRDASHALRQRGPSRRPARLRGERKPVWKGR